MKLCSLCGSTFDERVDFCFRDGTPLSLKRNGDDTLPISAPAKAPAFGPLDALDAPDPGSWALDALEPGTDVAISAMDREPDTDVTQPLVSPLLNEELGEAGDVPDDLRGLIPGLQASEDREGFPGDDLDEIPYAQVAGSHGSAAWLPKLLGAAALLVVLAGGFLLMPEGTQEFDEAQARASAATLQNVATPFGPAATEGVAEPAPAPEVVAAEPDPQPEPEEAPAVAEEAPAVAQVAPAPVPAPAAAPAAPVTRATPPKPPRQPKATPAASKGPKAVIGPPPVAPAPGLDVLWGGADQPASAKASVKVTSNPSGAELWVDGRREGNTPTDLKLKGGNHSFELRKKGFKTSSRSQSIAGGASMSIPFELVQDQQLVSVLLVGPAGMKGARVYLRGKDLGNIPVSTQLPAGRHEFQVVGEAEFFKVTRELRSSDDGKPVTVVLEQ